MINDERDFIKTKARESVYHADVKGLENSNPYLYTGRSRLFYIRLTGTVKVSFEKFLSHKLLSRHSRTQGVITMVPCLVGLLGTSVCHTHFFFRKTKIW